MGNMIQANSKFSYSRKPQMTPPKYSSCLTPQQGTEMGSNLYIIHDTCYIFFAQPRDKIPFLNPLTFPQPVRLHVVSP
jgi:hypothetical protein